MIAGYGADGGEDNTRAVERERRGRCRRFQHSAKRHSRAGFIRCQWSIIVKESRVLLCYGNINIKGKFEYKSRGEQSRSENIDQNRAKERRSSVGYQIKHQSE